MSSTPISPSNASATRFDPGELQTGPAQGRGAEAANGGVASDGFDLPGGDEPQIFMQNAPSPPPAPPANPAPSQTLPTHAPIPKDPAANPLTQQPPPAPPPGPGLPTPPNPHPYVQFTDGGFIGGLKGKF